MPSQIDVPWLSAIFSDLEAAVRRGDRVQALLIGQAILDQITTETATYYSVECQVRALIAEFDELASVDLPNADDLEHERSSIGPGESPSDIYDTTNHKIKGVIYPVWFGTNRKRVAATGAFTGERADHTSRGRALVYVPQTHRFGEIGNPFWRRLLRFQFRDDHLRIQCIEERNTTMFFSELQEEMAAANESGLGRHALVFIHGFNVSFDEAAIRAAQIGVDLKVPGATAFFSWPSRGTAIAYPVDEATIEASEAAITEFLLDFVANCGAEKVHVVAHSMGNRGFLRALQRIAADAESKTEFKLGQIFLAAPDVDRDLFLNLAHLYPMYSERTTLYASAADKPVHFSSKLHDAPRAGYFKPYTVAPNIDTVAVPDFNVDLLGHGYFAEADALLYDISGLIRHDDLPARRQRVVATMCNGESLWELRR